MKYAVVVFIILWAAIIQYPKQLDALLRPAQTWFVKQLAGTK